MVIYQTKSHSNGGVESITQVLEHARRTRGLIITNRCTPRADRWRVAGHEVVVEPFGPGKPWRWLQSNRRAAELIRRHGIRVLHANDIVALAHYGCGARWAGAKVVFNVRGIVETDRYRLKWRLARLISHRIVVLSQEMRDALSRRLKGVGPWRGAPIEYIYSIVDCDQMKPPPYGQRAAIRFEKGIASDEVAIAVVGAVSAMKQQLELIESITKDVAPNVKWRLHLVGDCDTETNEYARRCADEVARRRLGRRVAFHGFCNDVSKWYQAVDLVLVVSRREGLARCMIEALACGTPVLSFDVVSAREILEAHECGVVVDRNDWNGLWRAVAETMKDSGARASMGARGAAVARRLFAGRVNTDEYERMWQADGSAVEVCRCGASDKDV